MLSLLQKKLLLIFFYFLVILLGLSIFNDYGTSIDSDNIRLLGFDSLKNIYNFFKINIPSEILSILDDKTITQTQDDTITPSSGPLFNLVMAYIELFFNIKEVNQQYFLRHLSSFLLFLTASYFLFKVILLRYNCYSTAFLSVLFLLNSPRIFSNSFINSNDIVFLSFSLINLYAFIIFYRKPNFLNATICSLTTALCIGSRIFGVLFLLLSISIFIIRILRSTKIKKQIYQLINYIFFTLIFFIILWPYLWDSPFKNIYNIFNNLNVHMLNINIFYNNEFYYFKTVPWTYHYEWILYSTPFLYIVLFLFGFFFLIKRLFLRLLKIDNTKPLNDLWRGEKEGIDFIVILFFLVPLLFLIDSKKVSYNGWRHLFFVYPFFLIICCNALYRIKVFIFSQKKLYYTGFFIIMLIPTFFWMVKNHPYQNFYFNFMLSDSKVQNKFEVDYFGVSGRYALDYILKNNKNKIKVYSPNTIDLNLSLKLLNKSYISRVSIVDNQLNSDFIINNYFDWRGEQMPNDYQIPNNFKLYYEIKIDDLTINSIYKRNTFK
jgi:hypothetical protein